MKHARIIARLLIKTCGRTIEAATPDREMQLMSVRLAFETDDTIENSIALLADLREEARAAKLRHGVG